MGNFKLLDWVASESFVGKITKIIGTEYKVQSQDDEVWLNKEEITHVVPIPLRYLLWEEWEESQRRATVIPLGTSYKEGLEGCYTWIMEVYDVERETYLDLAMVDILEIGG